MLRDERRSIRFMHRGDANETYFVTNAFSTT